MHLVVDQVRDVGLPVLHIGDALAAAARAKSVSNVALLGTAYTMEHPFLRDHLAAAGVPTVVPDAAERADLQRIVSGELTQGIVEPASRERFTAIVDRLVREEGADDAALACTAALDWMLA